MKRIVAISSVFAILLAFVACEKKPIGPENGDDPFSFCTIDCDDDSVDNTRGKEDDPTITTDPTITDPDEDEDYDTEDDGGIVDPDEDEDYDSGDDDEDGK